MKILILSLTLLMSFSIVAQSKSKIIPIDKSILKLVEDTTEKSEICKKYDDFDYVFVVNKKTNKTDTILVYKDLFFDRKRKPKN